MAIVEQRWLRCRALEHRLLKVPGLAIVLSAPRLHDVMADDRLDRAHVLIVGDDQVDDAAIARLAAWKRGRAIRLVAFVPQPFLEASPQILAPFDGMVSIQSEMPELLRALGGAQLRSSLPRELSQRERDVLEMTAEGLSLKHSAALIGCSVQSVSTYRRRAMEKLGARNLADLVARFSQLRASDRTSW